MKTPTVTPFFFERSFAVRGGRVICPPQDPLHPGWLPAVSRTHVLLSPLQLRMQVWCELIHGEDDPIGFDRLHVELLLSLSTIWIRRPAKEALQTYCDSTEQFHRLIESVRSTLITANSLTLFPLISEDTIRAAFAPLFGVVAQLNGILQDALAERIQLWNARAGSIWVLPQHRFNRGLS